MNKKKALAGIKHKSERKLSQLVNEYIRSKPEKKEAIMAGIEIERDLAETCQICLE